jgi:hypothetical protein
MSNITPRIGFVGGEDWEEDEEDDGEEYEEDEDEERRDVG